MKSATTQTEASNLFEKHHGQGGFIQWKGTDVCMDFHCECGQSNHYDGFFAYTIKCKGCGNVYAASPNIEMVRILHPTDDNHLEDDTEE